MHLHRRLVVDSGGEFHALFAGNGGIALNDLGEYPACRFDAQGKGGNVNKRQLRLHFTGEHAALKRCALCHALVRVYSLGRLFIEIAPDELLYGGNTGGTTHQKDLVDFLCRHAGILHGLLHRLLGTLHQVLGECLEPCPRERHIKVLGTLRVHGDKGQINARLLHIGKLDLGFLRSLHETLRRHRILGEIYVIFLLEVLDQPVKDRLVEIIAAQERITACGFHLKNVVHQFQDGHIKGAAPKVKDQDLLIAVLAEAIGKSGSRRLVDDAKHIKAGNLSCVLRRLTLAIVEIGRHGNDRLCYAFSQIGFRIRLEFLENDGRDFLRRELLVANGDRIVLLAHVTLDELHRTIRIGHRLTARQLPHKALAVLLEANDRRRSAAALRVRDDCSLSALHDGDRRIRCPKINPNDF